jgi:hypothetical protein
MSATRTQHGPAGRGGPGQRNHVHPPVLGELLPDLVPGGGDDVEHARRQVGLLSGDLAEQRGGPRAVRRRLEHDAAARREGGPDLGQVDLGGKVPRSDGADHTDRLPAQRAAGDAAEGLRLAERGLPLVTLGEVGDPAQTFNRDIELRAVGEGDGRAYLGHQQAAQLVAVLDQGPVELTQAVQPEGDVGRPVGLVEGRAGRGDGGVHVGRGGVGGVADDLFGGRVDVREHTAVCGWDQPAVKQQLLGTA